jgi:lipopolysaccharide assembly protein A
MTKLLWLLRWILKAAIFFTLFAFALNNQHEVAAHFFFGNVWRTPLIVVVLIAFTGGLAVGVLAMVPRWWRQRNKVHQLKAQRAHASSTQMGDSTQM